MTNTSRVKNLKTTSWLTSSLLAITACIGALACTAESHQLLSEDGQRATWADCVEASERGQHMDACTFDSGSGCVDARRTTMPWTSAMCVDGDLLLTEFAGTSIPAARTGPCVDGQLLEEGGIGGIRVQLTRTGLGCAELDFCAEAPLDYEWSAEVCQRVPLASVESIEAPWTDCDGLIQGARDGQACEGEFFCTGVRQFSPGSSSGRLLSWCDDGILRMIDLTLIDEPATFL